LSFANTSSNDRLKLVDALLDVGVSFQPILLHMYQKIVAVLPWRILVISMPDWPSAASFAVRHSFHLLNRDTEMMAAAAL